MLRELGNASLHFAKCFLCCCCSGWWLLLPMGSRHTCISGQSLLELTSEQQTWSSEDVVAWEHQRGKAWEFCCCFLRLRGFVHFATKEGALRVLEESGALVSPDLESMCKLVGPVGLAGLFHETSTRFYLWQWAGSITFHRRKLDVKAPEWLSHLLLKMPLDVFCLSAFLRLFVPAWQKASESKKVMSDDERTEHC